MLLCSRLRWLRCCSLAALVLATTDTVSYRGLAASAPLNGQACNSESPFGQPSTAWHSPRLAIGIAVVLAARGPVPTLGPVLILGALFALAENQVVDASERRRRQRQLHARHDGHRRLPGPGCVARPLARRHVRRFLLAAHQGERVAQAALQRRELRSRHACGGARVQRAGPASDVHTPAQLLLLAVPSTCHVRVRQPRVAHGLRSSCGPDQWPPHLAVVRRGTAARCTRSL